MAGTGDSDPGRPWRGRWTAPFFLVVGLGLLVTTAVHAHYADVLGAAPEWSRNLLAALFGVLGLGLLLALVDVGPREEPLPEAEVWLCRSCGRPYVPGAHFCPHCSAPQTFFACTAPYERAHAIAWCVGKAGRHPSSRRRFVGLCVVCGSEVLGSAAWIVGPMRFGQGLSEVPAAGLEHALRLLLALAVLLAWGGILVIGIRNGLRVAGGEPLPPERDYGSPPWWTFDRDWGIPAIDE